MKKDVDDYLQEGIYGAKELNPVEKKAYLGTYRERVIIALTKAQVMKKLGLTQLQLLIKEYPDCKLLLNGNVDYRYFKAYKKIASQLNIPYTSVTNKEATTTYGIVLANDDAVDKEDILLHEEEIKESENEQEEKSFLSSLFNWAKDDD
ncbi:YueI family protein [Aquibacillus kalidii]|uniref:YueI family protein n=1 Tax=Aquibacillus kalidii TaxID=2762597 RepID=UPI0016463E28|nr:YueI family protein [Aquibacillus kalidii]